MASIEECTLAAMAMQGVQAEIDLTALVETYSALLFRVSHSVLRSRAEAEDVVQEVFVRVMQHRRGLSEIRDMRVWLVRIAWNLALDRKRSVRPDQMDALFAGSLAARGTSAEKALEEAQAMQAVLREIDRLPAKERQVLLLAALEELDTAQVAEVMGRSEAAMRALLFRARARLRERLETKGGSS